MKNSEREQDGVVLIELTFSLVVLLAVIGGSYELTRLLKLQDRLDFVSRVAASRVYRECTKDTVLVSPPGGMTVPQSVDQCLKIQVSDSIRTASQGLATGIDILLSVYTYEPASGVELQGQRWLSVTTNTGATECSDGIDNDGDGLIDTADLSCGSLGDTSESDGGGFQSRFRVGLVEDPSGTLFPVISANGNLVTAEVIATFDSPLAKIASLGSLDGSTRYAASIF